MEERIEESTEAGSEDASKKRERRRQVDGDPEPGVVRVRLPQAIGVKVKEIVAELKLRGAQVTLDELLSEYLDGIPERYFEDQLLSRTPEPYYLEAAAKVPELREMLIRHAKRGLMKGAAPATPREGRRKARKELAHEPATTTPESEG